MQQGITFFAEKEGICSGSSLGVVAGKLFLLAGRDVLVHNQTAQAMLCESIPREPEPRLELNIKNDVKGLEPQALVRYSIIESATVFGKVLPAKALCRCGAIAEIDRSVLRTKKDLGKVVECRRCRNTRIAREKDELDNDYFGSQECSD